MKKAFIATLVLGFIITILPFTAEAQIRQIGQPASSLTNIAGGELTPEELQQLIAQLQAQIQALMGQQGQVPILVPTTNPACYPFLYDLTMGSTGPDVLALQKFLQQQGLFNGEFSSYFGDLTRWGLSQFQVKVGIIPANGYFGPVTRGYIATLCAGVPPIPVNIPAQIGLLKDLSSMMMSVLNNNLPILPTNFSETWLPLTQQLSNTTSSLRKMINEKYAVNSQEQNFALLLDQLSSQLNQYQLTGSPSSIQLVFALLAQYQQILIQLENLVTSSGSNLPPSISSVSGPVKLDVGKSGTWTVQASDPENQSLKYSVLWDDEASVAAGIPTLSSIQQTATFTHTYTKAGTYQPLFTVTDSAGSSVMTSLSVVVGNTSQPAAQLPILKLVSTDVDIIPGDVTGQSDQAKATFVFDATAVGDVLFAPLADDFVVSVTRSGIKVGGVTTKSLGLSPSSTSVPNGSTYRINLSAIYNAEEDGFYKFTIAGAKWRYSSIQLKDQEIKRFTDFKTDEVFLNDYAQPPQPVLGIVGSNPKNGGVDARSVVNEVYEMGLDFSRTDDSLLDKNNYSVASYPFDAPQIDRIRWAYGNNYAITFAQLLKPGNRIRITHKPSNTSVCVGSLPGDVDGNGFVTAADLSLLNAIIAGATPNTLPIYQTDFNRDGQVTAADLTAAGQNFSTATVRTLPACPASTASVAPATQLANTLSIIQSLINQINQINAQLGN